MEESKSLEIARQYLGKEVEVVMDRLAGHDVKLALDEPVLGSPLALSAGRGHDPLLFPSR